MNAPLVSVIIPTFNRAHLVVEAIDSVLQQRDPSCEVIVVDDGSTDATPQALARYAEQVRIERQPQRGVAAARNHGVRVARGRWLAFLDSDDQWLPGKLTAQRAFHASADDIEISQTEEIWLRNGRRIKRHAHHQQPAGDFFMPSLERCLVSASAVMLSRDLFESTGGFDEGLVVCEDYDLWLRIARRSAIGFIPTPLVIKRAGHGDQLSERYWGMDRFRVAALSRLLLDDGLDPNRRDAVVDVMMRKCTILAHGARRRQREEEAERYLALARVCARV
jgi:GT2 family glycosyltransferase